jgi:hypothetical protein
MSRWEAVAVDDWTGVDASELALKEARAAGYAWRLNGLNSALRAPVESLVSTERCVSPLRAAHRPRR